MLIRADQLAKHSKPLTAIYVISGDETLLCQEAEDQIRSAAKQQGITERQVFQVGTSFDWSDFFNSSDNMSLFAERKLIELRFPKKPNKAATTAFKQIVEQTSSDNVLLITMDKIDASTKKTKWFKALEAASICVQVWPLDLKQYPSWISQRLQAKGLQIDPQALQILSSHVEGNLLAAQQAIEKLHLLHTQGQIQADDVQAVIGEDARYDVFTLVDTCLSGDKAQTCKK